MVYFEVKERLYYSNYVLKSWSIDKNRVKFVLGLDLIGCWVLNFEK